VLSGREQDALAFARRRYPSSQPVVVSKTDLRECNWKTQLRKLWQLQGEALVIFAGSLQSLHEPVLLKWTVLVHRCRETVLADSTGACEVNTRLGIVSLLPRTLFAAGRDLTLFAIAWFGLQCFQAWLRRRNEPAVRPGELDLAFLYPSQGGLDVPGGAFTHVTGFLSGLATAGAQLQVFSGQPLEGARNLHLVPGSRRLHLFREAAILSYNLRFIAATRRLLKQPGPRLFYQRHGRFLFAGAVLSRLLGIPLALEYNGSEVWIAKHWDPARFSPWLRLCEKVTLKSASFITVVSNALRHELMDAGIPEERILVNPNAVDPEVFHPGCGGVEVRQRFGFQADDSVVCFVGTFSYWHGVAVLEQAIRSLLESRSPLHRSLKFLLVGDGLLAPKIRAALEAYVQQGRVVFTGPVPHLDVRSYLDAADILVSPHVPMPDGTPFFGSPTKLFEYMAMGKAIVASALDQIAEVLEIGKTALLVEPGSCQDLAAAIERFAADPQLRRQLGRNARATVLARHTWQQNAKRVLAFCAGGLSDRTSCASGTKVEVRPRTETLRLEIQPNQNPVEMP
jgi:glycosyltransferase involved in cell wall biosynthesis